MSDGQSTQFPKGHLETLQRPFEKEQIKHRKGRGEQRLDYIETHSVIERLNEAFGVDWSFEVVSHEHIGSEFIVLGKLSVDGVVKMQYGGKGIEVYSKGDRKGEVISLSDNIKAATSDAIKKCATLFGVGLDLYSGDTGKAGNGARDDKEGAEGKGSDAGLQAIKSKYLDYLKKNEVFENEGLKKTWQLNMIGKASTSSWTKEDTQRAMKLVSWSVGVAGDQADAFFSALTKAKRHEGLVAAFLEKMGVEGITGIEDIKGWASFLEQAAESLEIAFEVDEADIPI